METQASPVAIQRTIWDGRIPLEIVLAPSESRTYDKTDPYLVCVVEISQIDSSAVLTDAL